MAEGMLQTLGVRPASNQPALPSWRRSGILSQNSPPTALAWPVTAVSAHLSLVAEALG